MEMTITDNQHRKEGVLMASAPIITAWQYSDTAGGGINWPAGANVTRADSQGLEIN